MCSTARTSICWGPASPRPTATPRSPTSRSSARETAAQFGLKADCRQSNREGELIDFIHEARAKKAAGIIINAGGYSHTSIALHDALMAVKIPTVEVHVSNIHARENFRHHSFTARAAFASLCGFGIDGYRLAITWPCRQNRRQGDSLTPSPVTHRKFRIKIMARQPDDTKAAKFKSDDSALIRELALLLDETSLTEIEIERAGLRVRVARNISIAASMPASYQPRRSPRRRRRRSRWPISPSIRAWCPRRWSAPPIGRPSPAPSRSSRSAAKVAVGQTLLIIEAMKTMNQIPSPRAGTVTQILVEDGQPVEFGEPLVIIE